MRARTERTARLRESIANTGRVPHRWRTALNLSVYSGSRARIRILTNASSDYRYLRPRFKRQTLTTFGGY